MATRMFRFESLLWACCVISFRTRNRFSGAHDHPYDTYLVDSEFYGSLQFFLCLDFDDNLPRFFSPYGHAEESQLRLVVSSFFRVSFSTRVAIYHAWEKQKVPSVPSSLVPLKAHGRREIR